MSAKWTDGEGSEAMMNDEEEGRARITDGNQTVIVKHLLHIVTVAPSYVENVWEHSHCGKTIQKWLHVPDDFILGVVGLGMTVFRSHSVASAAWRK